MRFFVFTCYILDNDIDNDNVNDNVNVIALCI